MKPYRLIKGRFSRPEGGQVVQYAIGSTVYLSDEDAERMAELFRPAFDAEDWSDPELEIPYPDESEESDDETSEDDSEEAESDGDESPDSVLKLLGNPARVVLETIQSTESVDALLSMGVEETSGKQRKSVLSAIESRLEELRDDEELEESDPDEES